MNRNLYIGATGAQAAQAALDITAHNLANVNTAGYRPRKAEFASLLYSNVHSGSDTMAGSGARVGVSESSDKDGAIRQTGRALDYAFTEDNRYFAVDADGTVAFTRNGDFKLSAEEGGDYLVTAAGYYVLGADGERVVYEGADALPAFGVYRFQNEDGLERLDGGLFLASETSGAAEAAEDRPQAGWLQDAGVDLTEEMLDMLRFQRGFQMNTKIIQIADELAQTVNSLRG